MARQVLDGARRRRIFLDALAGGEPVARACAHGRLAWTTLYRWRRQDAAFRAAWDAALHAGADALAARFDGEMMRRAVDGIDEPVFRNGTVVGTRKRYSDRLLMFGIRDLRLRRATSAPLEPPPAAGSPPLGPPTDSSRITVVVRQFGAPDDEGGAAPPVPRDAG